MNDMRHHFKIEDNLIVDALLPHQSTQPEVASALDTLEEQHKQLNALTAEIKASQENKNGHANDSVVTVEQVKALANLLYDHVRFEERELFPMVEKYLTEPELNAIYHASPDNIKHVDEQR
jgi:hemerythrin-like domain-containing protein